ncbi:MAG: Hsp20/alpha crystallin family protein [Methanobacteriota archaeon]
MPEREEKVKDLSKLVEQSVSTLQEVDRRLQMVRSDLATLIQRAAILQPGPLPPGSPPGSGPRPDPLRSAVPAPPTFAPGFGGPATAGGPVLHANPLFGGAGPPLGFGPISPLFGFNISEAAGRSLRELRTLPPSPRLPSIDLADEGNEFVVQVELPGVKKDDLDLIVAERSVTVTAVSRPELGDAEGTVLLNERGPIQYRRTIPLPSEAHTSQSTAALKDGVLTLRIAKKVPTEGPHRLDVAYG